MADGAYSSDCPSNPTQLTRLDSLPLKYSQQFPASTDLPRPSKFGNKPTEYLGFTYDSKREASFARDCVLMLKAKQLYDWNQQVRISFDVTVDGRLIARSKNVYLPQVPHGVRIAKHLWNHDVDFLLVYPGGGIELVEVKSSATKTRTWRHNLAMLEATLLREHPNIKYRVEL